MWFEYDKAANRKSKFGTRRFDHRCVRQSYDNTDLIRSHRLFIKQRNRLVEPGRLSDHGNVISGRLFGWKNCLFQDQTATDCCGSDVWTAVLGDIVSCYGSIFRRTSRCGIGNGGDHWRRMRNICTSFPAEKSKIQRQSREGLSLS